MALRPLGSTATTLGTVDVSDKATRDLGKIDVKTLPAVTMGSVTAAKLQMGKQSRVSITCTDADTDYAADAEIPAGTQYLVVWAENAFTLAVDEATSATVGILIPANTVQTIPVSFGAAEGDSKVHAQSATAATVVNVGYLED